jgi:hypothetical protein
MQQRSLQQVRVSVSLIFLIHALIILNLSDPRTDHRNLGFEEVGQIGNGKS